jgi:hypothetical protein
MIRWRGSRVRGVRVVRVGKLLKIARITTRVRFRRSERVGVVVLVVVLAIEIVVVRGS